MKSFAKDYKNSIKEIYVEADENEVIGYISPNCEKILGYKSEEVVGAKISKYAKVIKSEGKNTLGDSGENFANTEVIILDKSGLKKHFDVEVEKSNGDNYKNLIKIWLYDITKYKLIEERAQRLMAIFENSRDIIYRADILPQFKFTYISPAIEEILGISAEDILKDPEVPFKTVHPDDCKYLIKKIEGTADYSKPIQTRFKNKEGRYIWLEDYVIPIYDNNNVLIAIEGVSRNVQERKELEEELKKLSYFDYLTGLYNRAYINEQIGIINSEKNVPVGVFIFDLDNLKRINDTLGHLYGDLLLKNTTNFLSNMFNEAIIGRVGGDEFAVILEQTSLEIVEEYYNNLNRLLQKHNSSCNGIPVEVSVGYAFSENSMGNMYDLINIADKNMYEHKKSKKTNYL